MYNTYVRQIQNSDNKIKEDQLHVVEFCCGI